MPEILSQSQIDSLLSELTSGMVSYDDIETKNTKKVKEYDFKSPKKFTKEQLKLLNGVYEIFSRHLASYFSGMLRTVCQITVASIEEQPYYEYNNALPDSVLIGVMELKPLEGTVLVDISNPVSFAFIERLLGGAGNGVTVYDREFTEIEIALMERVFKQIGVLTSEAWANHVEIEPNLQNIETNSRLIQSISMDEDVVIVVLDVSIKHIKGTICFCFPCMSLEPILDSINKSTYLMKRKIDSGQESVIKEAIANNIKNSEIEIRGIFGKTELTLKEILSLNTGDVLRLNQKVENDVKLTINDKTWFYGIPGIRKNKKVIKINKVV